MSRHVVLIRKCEGQEHACSAVGEGEAGEAAGKPREERSQ